MDEPRAKSILFCLVVVGFAFLAAAAFEDPLFGLISFAVLAISTSRYSLPTRYLLDDDGLEIRHLLGTRRHPWQQFRRADLHKDGLFLSPFLTTNRLDSFRGCFIRFGAGPDSNGPDPKSGPDRDTIMRFVKNHVPSC